MTGCVRASLKQQVGVKNYVNDFFSTADSKAGARARLNTRPGLFSTGAIRDR